MSRRIVFASLLSASFATGLAAAPAVKSTDPKADACLRTVNAMGASMGQNEEKHGDGTLAYRFIVRTNGIDYDVICEAATGMVRDVSPRTAASGTAQ